MNSVHSERRREVFDLELNRDRRECSLGLDEICPPAAAGGQTWRGNAIGFGVAALTICAGGYLAHIVR